MHRLHMVGILRVNLVVQSLLNQEWNGALTLYVWDIKLEWLELTRYIHYTSNVRILTMVLVYLVYKCGYAAWMACMEQHRFWDRIYSISGWIELDTYYRFLCTKYWKVINDLSKILWLQVWASKCTYNSAHALHNANGCNGFFLEFEARLICAT